MERIPEAYNDPIIIPIFILYYQRSMSYSLWDLSRIEVKIQSVESPTSLSGNFFVPITEDKERCRSPALLYPPIANIAEVFKLFVTTLCCTLNRGRISSVQERK